MKLAISIVIFLACTLVSAGTADEQNEDNITILNTLIDDISGVITPSGASQVCKENITFINCSENNMTELTFYKTKAEQMLNEWNEKIIKAEKAGLIEFEKKKKRNKDGNYYYLNISTFEPVKKILSCIAEELKELKLDCSSTSKRCLKGDKAHTFPLINSPIYICDTYFKIGDRYKTGTLIHEVSHKCGTNDYKYFNSKDNPPKGNWITSWYEIADTYEYWGSYGFCIPEKTCNR